MALMLSKKKSGLEIPTKIKCIGNAHSGSANNVDDGIYVAALLEGSAVSDFVVGTTYTDKTHSNVGTLKNPDVFSIKNGAIIRIYSTMSGNTSTHYTSLSLNNGTLSFSSESGSSSDTTVILQLVD